MPACRSQLGTHERGFINTFLPKNSLYMIQMIQYLLLEAHSFLANHSLASSAACSASFLQPVKFPAKTMS